MKPRKTDVSVAGRLGGAASTRRNLNYGVDRLGIARADSADGTENAREDQSAEPTTQALEAAAPAGEQQAAPNSVSQQSVASVVEPPVASVVEPPVASEVEPQPLPAAQNAAAAPSQGEVANNGPAQHGRRSRRITFRRMHWVGAIGVLGAIAIVVLVVKFKSAANVPTNVSAGVRTAAPALPTAAPTPAIKMPTPPAGRRFNLTIAVRSKAADLALAIQVARMSSQQASMDFMHWLESIQPAAASKVEPKVPLAVDPVPKPTPSPSPTPAVRYRDCPPGFSLSGVIRTPDGAFANINGRMVKIGQTMNSAKLVSIGDYSVEMELDGQRFILAIGQEDSAPAPSKKSASDDDDSSDAPEPATKPAKPKSKHAEE